MRTRILLAAMAWVCAQPAQADFALTYSQDGRCDMDPDAFYVRGAMLRVDSRDGSALYDGVEQFMTYLDHTAHKVFQLELDDDAIDLQTDIGSATGHRMDKEMARAREMMDANRGQMQEACRQLEKQGMACPDFAAMGLGTDGAGIDTRALMAQQQQAMANMDPKMLERAGIDADDMQAMQAEQNEAFAQLDAQQRRADAEVVDTGRSEQIAGIACTVREWRLGDEVLEQRCDADWPALGLDAREQAALERAIKRMQRWGASMDPLMERFDAPRDERAGANVTLRKTCYQAGQATGSVTARVAREALAPTLFDIPTGYTSGL
jgi:hypothetical protein